MAIEQSILLGVNRITTVTATNELGEFVDDNLLNTQPSELWKASSVPSPAVVTITGELDKARTVGGFGLGNHNLTNESIQLELFEDAGMTIRVYNTIWSATDAYYSWGTGSWGDLDSTWGGFSLSGTEIDQHFIKTFTSVYCRYYRVTLSSLTTAPSAGVLFIGDALQSGVSRDPSIPVIDPSAVTMTRGQAMRSDNQPTFREISVRYVALTSTQAHNLRLICRETGKRGLMIFSLIPGASGLEELETALVCRLVSWDGPTRMWESNQESRYTAELTFREAL